jgi:hypothetical protein
MEAPGPWRGYRTVSSPRGGGTWLDEQNCGYGCFRQKGLEGYLGLMFQIEGETYYGWALLSMIVTAKGAKPKVVVTLKGYAYQTTPGVPIDAVQTK